MAKSEIVLRSFANSKMLQTKLAEKGSSITKGWQTHLPT